MKIILVVRAKPSESKAAGTKARATGAAAGAGATGSSAGCGAAGGRRPLVGHAGRLRTLARHHHAQHHHRHQGQQRDQQEAAEGFAHAQVAEQRRQAQAGGQALAAVEHSGAQLEAKVRQAMTDCQIAVASSGRVPRSFGFLWMHLQHVGAVERWEGPPVVLPPAPPDPA
jgi:hypothetical protein